MLLISGGEVVKSKGKWIFSSNVCFVCFIFDFERKPNVLKWIVLAYESSNAKSETLPPASNKNNIPASFSFFPFWSRTGVDVCPIMWTADCVLGACWWLTCLRLVCMRVVLRCTGGAGANKRARPCRRHKNLRKDKGNLTLTGSERIEQDTAWNFMPSGEFGTSPQCFKTSFLFTNLNSKFHFWHLERSILGSWVPRNANWWKKTKENSLPKRNR